VTRKLAFFEVTWQQASKHIKKSIIVATLKFFRSWCLLVGGDKEGKASFAVPDSCPVGCGTVSTGISDFPQENFAYIFWIEQWKCNGNLFKKLVNFASLSILNYLFPYHLKIFEVPPINIAIRVSKC